MQVRLPMLSADARGRYAKLFVFSIWRGINYARAWANPANPQSERQVRIRGFLSSLVAAWDQLSDIQRSAWRVFASTEVKTSAVGHDYTAPGRNTFIGHNVLVLDRGLTQVDDPPSEPKPAPATFSLEAGAAGEIAVTLDTALPAGINGDVWITPPLAAGREPLPGDFRHNQYLAPAATGADIIGLQGGGRYGVRVRTLDASGQASQFMAEVGVAGAGE